MARALLLFLLFALFPMCMLSQFLVDGVAPCFDAALGKYLLCVDEAAWDSPAWEAEVRLPTDSPWTSLRIDGTVADGLFRFTDISGTKTYNLEAATAEGTVHATLQLTFLPILQLRTLGNTVSNDFVGAELHVQEGDGVCDELKIKVKHRGGTTNEKDRHKRNFKIKVIDDEGGKRDVSLLGLRKDNSWVLDAGQVDLFRLRNYVAAGIWQDFAPRPYYADQEPKARSATRGTVVELFVDDRYEGIYHLCEPIDRKQMKLKKFDADGTIHGALWKATSFGDATFWNVPAAYDNSAEKNDVWEVKYPSLEDLCPSDYTTLHDAIEFVATASATEFNRQVADYFDMPVLIDYYLFVNLTNAFDLCGKNIYWAVYDKAADRRLTPAMWDMDCTMGQNYKDNPLHPDYVSSTTPLLVPNKIFHQLLRLNTDHFQQRMAERYANLRQGIFSTSNLQQRYADVFARLKRCGAVDREEQRWSHDTDIAGLPLDMEQELAYITTWIDERMAFLDSNWLRSTDISDEQAEPAATRPPVTITGLPVPDGYRGIVIMNGRKILMK
jgi:hypothetical protein